MTRADALTICQRVDATKSRLPANSRETSVALALLSDVAMIEESSGTLTLRGAIGVSQADDLARAARSVAEGDGDVTIDCAGVEHFDLCSAQILLALKRRLDGNGRRVHWRGPPEDVTAALATTGFAETLEIRAGSTT